MENINKQFEMINEILDRIDIKQKEINDKLDKLIKALHEYDDDNIYSGYDEPNEALLKAAGLYNELEANKRMDVIGQNGNTGEYYENEIINNPANTNVDKKKRDKRNKWVSPYPPNPKRNVNKNNAG
jgi:hypothetical protein